MDIYNMLPYILAEALVLNILGNTIKMTFKINSNYIVWILLIMSMIINFIFFGINFKSFFIAFIAFSFSVSSYDLVKYTSRIRNEK